MCWAGSIYCFGAGLTYYLINLNRPVDNFLQLEQKYNWLVSSWYSVTAAVDIVITLSMCYLCRGIGTE